MVQPLLLDPSMRNYLVGIAVVSLTSLTTVAHAEPSSYVESGLMVGVNNGFIVGTLSASGGVRVGSSDVWIHAAVADGNAAVVEDNGSGTYLQLRGGPELRKCVLNGAVCGIGGVDIGMEHATYSEPMGLSSSAQMVVDDTTHTIAVPHLGFDLGGKHLRYRPSIQLPISLSSAGATDQFGHGVTGIDATGSIAYVW